MSYPWYKRIGWVLGPLLFFLIWFLPVIDPLSPLAMKVLAVASWMICWWITEAVGLAVTALIPLTVFPLLGIMNIETVAANYANPVIYLFFGGFVIALAMEKVQLHKRIALTIIRLVGTDANGIILGFMLATALLSMWISNTATTVMMLPIALSVIQLMIGEGELREQSQVNFALSIMLGIAFAANIGGTATLIGTPPNSVMLGILENEYQVSISFLDWMLLGVPFAIVMLAASYWLLVKVLYPNRLGQLSTSRNMIQAELARLGPLHKAEKRVLLIFVATATLWICRGLINRWLPGLGLTDTTISMVSALSLFVVPMGRNAPVFVLQWEDTAKLPWGILVLFGGGMALAAGMSQAGLVELIGEAVSSNQNMSLLLLIAVLAGIMLFMTELMSNVALVAIFVPVVIGIALGMEVEILQLVIPVTLASSCAFMLPMATPPNAIVFASGHIKVYQMAKIGVFLNLIAISLLLLLAAFWVPVLF